MARCIIHTDYIDPTKTEEILQRVARIISEAYKANAQSSAERHKKRGDKQ